VNRETAAAIYDRVTPGWRDAPIRSGKRRVSAPYRRDQNPSLDIDEQKFVWFDHALGEGGGAVDLARRTLGEDGARDLLRELGNGATQYSRTSSSRSTIPRKPQTPANPVEIVGPATSAQIAVLKRSRRIKDGQTLDRVGAREVHWNGARWLGIPTLESTWKLWALNSNGVPRLDAKGKLERRNVGAVSLVVSPALREGSRGNVARLWDVEGESDWIACVDAGIEHVIATTGGAGSSIGHTKHADWLTELKPTEVVVVRDLDDPGREGADKACDWWRGRGVAVRVLTLPEGLGRGGDLRDFLNGRPGLNGEAATEPLGGADDLAVLSDKVPLQAPESHYAYFANKAYGDEDWETPIDFGSECTGSAVPLEAFPAPIRDYVADVARVHKLPEDLAAGVALGVLAAAGARRAIVAIGDTHTEPLNLFMLPTAAPGERKAQAIRSMTFPLEEEEKRLCLDSRDEIRKLIQVRSIGEKRVKVLEDQAAKERDSIKRTKLADEAAAVQESLPSVPAPPQLIFDDATPEYISKALAEQSGRVAIISEEAGSLVAMMTGQYSKTGESNLDVYLKAYDGGQIRVGRISREGDTVECPSLTIVVTPQPAILDQMSMHGELRGRGLLGRLCIILPVSQVGTRRYENRAIDPKLKDTYSQAIQSILRRPIPEPNEMPRFRLEGEALAIWKQYADAVEFQQADGGSLASIRDWASKHAGRVARIAGLFHLVRHSDRTNPEALPISAEDVAAAWAVGEWLQTHALAVFDHMGSDEASREAKKILEWIRKNDEPRFSVKKLHDNRRGKDRPSSFLPALKILEERGFIREVPPTSDQKRGRKALPLFDVNPMTLTLYSRNTRNAVES